MTNERLWEGIDLAMRAWTTHDGPFNYEGRFWHKRAVNIWPRPYQQPHPPVWITGSSDRENVRKVAQHGFTFATFLQPYENTRSLFDDYRKHYVDAGVPDQGGTAFLPLVYTADSDSGGGKGRAGIALVHPLQQDRAAVQEPARLCLDRAQRARRCRASSAAAPRRCARRASTT